MDNESERGRCATCGFVAKRTAVQDGFKRPPIYHEISTSERETGIDLRRGYAETVSGSGRGFGVTVDLACIRGVAQLDKGNATEELWRDRQCDSWYPYMPGFSPQEHLQDFRMQELERLDREIQDARERDRRAFEERLQRESSNLSNKLIIAALILGIFQLLAAFVAMTRDSMFMKWWLGQ